MSCKKTICAVISAVLFLLSVCVSANAANAGLGDVDLNGRVTASDARLALRYSARLEKLTAEQIANAAVLKRDGKTVRAADARKILRVSARLTTFDEGEHVYFVPVEIVKTSYDPTIDTAWNQTSRFVWSGDKVVNRSTTTEFRSGKEQRSSEITQEFHFDEYGRFLGGTETKEDKTTVEYKAVYANGNLSRVEQYEGSEMVCAEGYDPSGRIIMKQTLDLTPELYVYDGDGKLIRSSDDMNQTEYKYNAHGEVESISRKAIIDDGFSSYYQEFTYQYDSEGRVLLKKDITTDLADAYSYDNEGRVSTRSTSGDLGSGDTFYQFYYDDNGLLIKQTSTYADEVITIRYESCSKAQAEAWNFLSRGYPFIWIFHPLPSVMIESEVGMRTAY